MRKYLSFFVNRFQMGIQYRASAIGGFITQFIWGLMGCIAYKAIMETNPTIKPMEYSALVSYIWLNQAFLILFNTWAADNDIFNLIIDGGIAYEMCRPVSIYNMWFAKNLGGRISTALLRCIPLLILAFLIPAPFRLSFPSSAVNLLLFFITLILGVFVTIAFCMFVYILAFFTISPQGLRMIMTGVVEFLSGAIIPLPFIPQPIRHIIELLPFAAMQNVPLRIYSGNLAGSEMLQAILLQIFWIITLIFTGKLLCKCAERRVVVQGG